MQVFVPYSSPIDVARCLSNDPRRLAKQITEADQILDAIRGKTKWSNHPVVKMYAHFTPWLWYYRETLNAYRNGDTRTARHLSHQCDTTFKPPFLTDELCDQHKRRLYTKAPKLYPQFATLGTTEENWYVVDGEIVKYIKGKKI